MHPARFLAYPLIGLLLCGAGWRQDGSGVQTRATLSGSDEPTVAWKTPLTGPSNASPVRMGEHVCTVAEPHHVICLQATDGTAAWQAAHPLLEVLPAQEKAQVATWIAEAEAAGPQLEATQRDYSLTMRRLRAGDDVADQLQALGDRLGELQAVLDRAAPYQVPDTPDEIGFTSPTPATDGQALFVLFANGVVVAHEADGSVRWRTWLGFPKGRLHGYDGRPTASPLLHGGSLIVPFNQMTALDPATGAVRWKTETYLDYGTPTAATVGGKPVLLTPHGSVLDARDGRVVAENLGDVHYVGAYAMGERAWWIGTKGYNNSDGPAQVKAWDLRWQGDRIDVTPVAQTGLPFNDRIYASPVAWGEHLFVVSRKGHWALFRADNGQLEGSGHFQELNQREVWSSPTVAGSSVVLSTNSGETYRIDDPQQMTLRPMGDLAPTKATPWFEGNRRYVRTREALWAVE